MADLVFEFEDGTKGGVNIQHISAEKIKPGDVIILSYDPEFAMAFPPSQHQIEAVAKAIRDPLAKHLGVKVAITIGTEVTILPAGGLPPEGTVNEFLENKQVEKPKGWDDE